MKTKVCTKCKIRKSIFEFYKHKYRLDGYRDDCKSCISKYNKRRWRQNKRKFAQRSKDYYLKNKKRFREYTLKRQYNLTLKQHKQIYISQDGCCALCKNPTSYSDMKTDHNHFTGKVRQLLCDSCNKGIGWFKEDTNLLFEAIKYLNKHKSE